MERFPPHDCRTCGAAPSLYSPGALGQSTTEYPMPRWSRSGRHCAPIFYTLSLFTFSPYKIVSLSSLPVSTCRSYTIVTSLTPHRYVRSRPLEHYLICLSSLPVSTCRSYPVVNYVRALKYFRYHHSTPFFIYFLALQISFTIIVASKQLPFILGRYFRSRHTNSFVINISPGHTPKGPGLSPGSAMARGGSVVVQVVGAISVRRSGNWPGPKK